eukprot:3333281-Prymnesium_polylepis.1
MALGCKQRLKKIPGLFLIDRSALGHSTWWSRRFRESCAPIYGLMFASQYHVREPLPAVSVYHGFTPARFALFRGCFALFCGLFRAISR